MSCHFFPNNLIGTSIVSGNSVCSPHAVASGGWWRIRAAIGNELGKNFESALAKCSLSTWHGLGFLEGKVVLCPIYQASHCLLPQRQPHPILLHSCLKDLEPKIFLPWDLYYWAYVRKKDGSSHYAPGQFRQCGLTDGLSEALPKALSIFLNMKKHPYGLSWTETWNASSWPFPEWLWIIFCFKPLLPQ
jgi:hypothetical protein